MTREELIRHLHIIVEAQQRRYSRRFSHQAKVEFDELISSGVDRMTFAERNSEASIKQAEDNIKSIFLACYNRSAQRRETEISRDTFRNIRMMECPKWPYC